MIVSGGRQIIRGKETKNDDYGSLHNYGVYGRCVDVTGYKMHVDMTTHLLRRIASTVDAHGAITLLSCSMHVLLTSSIPLPLLIQKQIMPLGLFGGVLGIPFP